MAKKFFTSLRNGLGLGLLGLSLALSGCGFQLKGTEQFAFERLYAQFNAGSKLGYEFERQMAQYPAVKLIREPKRLSEAQVVLHIQNERAEKSVMAASSAALVREFQLRYQVQFMVRNIAGKELIDSTEIFQLRQLSYSETGALAKEVEEQQIFRQMEADISQQLIRRLASIKAL